MRKIELLARIEALQSQQEKLQRDLERVWAVLHELVEKQKKPVARQPPASEIIKPGCLPKCYKALNDPVKSKKSVLRRSRKPDRKG